MEESESHLTRCMQENILSTRVVFQELGHIIHLKQKQKIFTNSDSIKNQYTPPIKKSSQIRSPSRKKKCRDRIDSINSCPLPDLAMDDDPAILPGRVPYDIGGGEELLGAGRLILRHGLHHHSLAPPAPRFNLRGCGRKKTTLR